MSSIRSQIGLALKERLETIKTANGWSINIPDVYYDKIPMGLELTPEQMPALFLLDDGAKYHHQHQYLEIMRSFRVQIIDVEEATDDKMNELIRLVAKAVYAASPSAQVQDQYRFHSSIVWVQMDSDETDLHMIEGNRIASTRLIVHYRTRPYDL